MSSIIDNFNETYYSLMLRDRNRDENGNLLRGLSRNQICVGVATDKKHTICFVEGFGKPSQKRSYDTFKDHIASGSTLIHDKENTHKKLVAELNLKSVSYSSSDLKGLADSENPLDPVNRIHCLLKMFLNAHSGFCRDEIQDYLICIRSLLIHLTTIWKRLRKSSIWFLKIPNRLNIEINLAQNREIYDPCASRDF